ncbi:GHKL domain-containing protein [bacterium]|nr:GHKL domain-containing protein [bacterium]
MSVDSEKLQTRIQHRAQDLTAILLRRYWSILLCVGALLVIDQAVLQPQLARLSVYAPQINVAGRQRMLSQRLVKLALVIQATHKPEESEKELRETLDQWRTAHVGLLDGNAALGLPQTTSPEIRQAFAQLDPHFDAMVSAAEAMLRGKDSPATVATLLRHESQYLAQMDRIVGMYEVEAQSQATNLRYLGLLATISVIGLMLALGHLVLRPATRTIHDQVDLLEDRVAARTAELTDANQALEREIKVREEAEQRSHELSGQLAHTSRVMSMGQLATGLAHEINQPLAAISNYAATCKLVLESESPDREKLVEPVQCIERAAQKAGEIVRGMRSFLRPGQTPLCEVKVSELIEEVLALCHHELARNEVKLTLCLPEHAEVCVVASKIQQVLLNLIQNAIQAMQSAPSEKRELQINATAADQNLLIEVVDRGPGFGPQVDETVFQPFFTTKPSGLGMGLAISRSIIQEHRGKLWVENRQIGAAVCFTLPIDQAQHDQVGTSTDRVCR